MPFYEKLLENQLVYRLAQSILVPGSRRLLKEPFDRLFRKSSGWILDVGCGPRPITPDPKGTLVGVDINPNYLRTYTGGFLDQNPRRVGNRSFPKRRLAYQVSADALPFRNDVFDEIRNTSFFHHMDDVSSRKTLSEMNRCLKPGKRIIVIDAVWPRSKWLRPIAWATLSLDRGFHVRSESQFRGLLTGALPGLWSFQRVTYTYTGMEYLIAIYRKRSHRSISLVL